MRLLTIFTCGLFLLPALTGSAQTENNGDLPTQFRKYQSGIFQEKVFVHTDKTCYLAGELIWFCIYNVDEYFNRPSENAAITYIELIGKDHRPVLQTGISMQHGKGNGSFLVPASIASGIYTLRAYTAWMKNFSPDFFYQQPVTIINTLSAPAVDPAASAVRSARDNDFDCRFFPEGGSLVEGLPARVACKIVDSKGTGVNGKIAVIDQQNDTAAVFHTSLFGMGSFTITPKKGAAYHARVTLGDTTIDRPLPAPFTQGYTMRLTQIDDNRISVTVNTNISTADPTLYLFVHTRHLGKVFLMSQAVNGSVTFSIDKTSLGEGISHFTVFNANKTPVCERLYFRPLSKKISFTASTSKTAYAPREKVDCSLSAKDPAGHPVAADLSMSIFRLDSLQNLPEENILTWLWLSSECKGRIESPQFYFEDHGDTGREAADNLMLTQGWRRFRWEDLLQNKQPYFEFLPELTGPVITGRIVDKTSGRPIPAVTGYLSIPGKYFSFSTAVSQADGAIRFNPTAFTGNNEMVVQTSAAADSNDRIDCTGPFSEKMTEQKLPVLLLHPDWEPQLLQRSIDAQVENSYLTRQKGRFLDGKDTDTLPFYGLPDHQYRLDDYTRFVTLEEVIREYVLDVRVRRQSGKYYYRVKNSLFNVFFDDDPMLLIDGVPVFDADRLMAMDPLKIRQIDVVTHKFYTGSLVSSGIVNFRTYEGDLGGYALDANAVAIQYKGLQEKREFYTPLYDNKERQETRIPDRRNVLLWRPDGKTDSLGQDQSSFYTSDLAGKFALVIQGLTADGLAGSTTLTFTVKP